MKKRLQSRSGFSLIEVSIGFVGACILALTFGIMLVFFMNCWVRSSTTVDLERDARTAISTFERAARPASASNIVTGVNTFQVTVNGTTKSFSRTGNSLLYNPNGVGGGVVLVANRLNGSPGVSGFSTAYTNSPRHAVLLTLNLVDPSSGATLSVNNMCIKLRN
jgi:hypothetical protein